MYHHHHGHSHGYWSNGAWLLHQWPTGRTCPHCGWCPTCGRVDQVRLVVHNPPIVLYPYQATINRLAG